MSRQVWKEVEDITRQMYASGMSDVEVRGVFKEFEAKFEMTKALQLAADRAYKEGGKKGLEDWIEKEMLVFLQARTGLKIGVPQQKSLGKGNVVYDRVAARETVNAYLKSHPELSFKDAALAVGKSNPELFR